MFFSKYKLISELIILQIFLCLYCFFFPHCVSTGHIPAHKQNHCGRFTFYGLEKPYKLLCSNGIARKSFSAKNRLSPDLLVFSNENWDYADEPGFNSKINFSKLHLGPEERDLQEKTIDSIVFRISHFGKTNLKCLVLPYLPQNFPFMNKDLPAKFSTDSSSVYTLTNIALNALISTDSVVIPIDSINDDLPGLAVIVFRDYNRYLHYNANTGSPPTKTLYIISRNILNKEDEKIIIKQLSQVWVKMFEHNHKCQSNYKNTKIIPFEKIFNIRFELEGKLKPSPSRLSSHQLGKYSKDIVNTDDETIEYSSSLQDKIEILPIPARRFLLNYKVKSIEKTQSPYFSCVSAGPKTADALLENRQWTHAFKNFVKETDSVLHIATEPKRIGSQLAEAFQRFLKNVKITNSSGTDALEAGFEHLYVIMDKISSEMVREEINKFDEGLQALPLSDPFYARHVHDLVNETTRQFGNRLAILINTLISKMDEHASNNLHHNFSFWDLQQALIFKRRLDYVLFQSRQDMKESVCTNANVMIDQHLISCDTKPNSKTVFKHYSLRIMPNATIWQNICLDLFRRLFIWRRPTTFFFNYLSPTGFGLSNILSTVGRCSLFDGSASERTLQHAALKSAESDTHWRQLSFYDCKFYE